MWLVGGGRGEVRGERSERWMGRGEECYGEGRGAGSDGNAVNAIGACVAGSAGSGGRDGVVSDGPADRGGSGSRGSPGVGRRERGWIEGAGAWGEGEQRSPCWRCYGTLA